MKLFKCLGEIDFTDTLQLEGAFSVTHINYGEAPFFNGIDARDIIVESRNEGLSSKHIIEDVLGQLRCFDGTQGCFEQEDILQLWELYWKEYIIAFDTLIEILPKSVVTAYVGRQTIELGLKYLMLKTTNDFHKTHNLKDLAYQFFSSNEIYEDYMDDIEFFCESYTTYIEGGNAEYFRFPEYKEGFFAGNRLDVTWLSYNFALIILKLLHYARIHE